MNQSSSNNKMLIIIQFLIINHIFRFDAKFKCIVFINKQIIYYNISRYILI